MFDYDCLLLFKMKVFHHVSFIRTYFPRSFLPIQWCVAVYVSAQQKNFYLATERESEKIFLILFFFAGLKNKLLLSKRQPNTYACTHAHQREGKK